MKSQDRTAKQDKPTNAKPAVIATRKSCDADGTGLSHFVLMDREVQR